MGRALRGRAGGVLEALERRDNETDLFAAIDASGAALEALAPWL